MGVEKYDVKPNDTLMNRCIGYGVGNSKKEGEQNAAKMALIIYGLLEKDQYDSSDIFTPNWNNILNDNNNNNNDNNNLINLMTTFIIDDDRFSEKSL
jgi:hypothetical protein